MVRDTIYFCKHQTILSEDALYHNFSDFLNKLHRCNSPSVSMNSQNSPRQDLIREWGTIWSFNRHSAPGTQFGGKDYWFNHFMPFTVFFYWTYCNNRSLGKSLLSRNRNIKKKKKANISFYNDDFPATFKRMKTSLKILFQKIDLFLSITKPGVYAHV